MIPIFTSQVVWVSKICITRENNAWEFLQRSLHSYRVTAWCAVSKSGEKKTEIPTYIFYIFAGWNKLHTINKCRKKNIKRKKKFFEERNHAIAVTAWCYKDRYLFVQLLKTGIYYMTFTLNEIGDHSSRSRNLCSNILRNGRSISLRGYLPWAAQSPDLGISDYFFVRIFESWGLSSGQHLIDEVSKTKL